MPRPEQRSLQPKSNINTALKQNFDITLAINDPAVIEDNQNLDRQILLMITKSYVNADMTRVKFLCTHAMFVKNKHPTN